MKQLTTAPTEADLEAKIDAAVDAAFPWLTPGGLRHQTKFEFKFGHRTVEIDGKEVSKVQGRSDIIVYYDDIPLAVLELKREGLQLTQEDHEQGLSYARMLHPRPPLVVVTNGSETVFLDSFAGNVWNPATPSEAEVKRLIENAGTIAATDMKRAIEVLLGPRSAVWMTAMRAASDVVIADLSGDWRDQQLPFVKGFSIPRVATQRVFEGLRGPKRIVVVDGPPLVGKSNVLRQLADESKDSDELAVLFVEADGGAGSGLLQIISAVLADALGWQVTADETRTWLQRLSKQPGPTLVLAVDGIGAVRDEIRRDVEELSGDAFGNRVRLVLAMDDTVTPKLLKSETGRKATRIGRRASQIGIETLNKQEFGRTVNLLDDLRIGFIPGGQSAPEYRVPWVLRSVIGGIVAEPKYADKHLMAGIPPLLGPDLLRETRERFQDDEEVRHRFRALAEAVLLEIEDPKRQAAAILESMETFTVRRKTLRGKLDATELGKLTDQGLIKLATNGSNEQIIVPRLPELLASEVALCLSEGLADTLYEDGTEAAAEWLVRRCGSLPLGDVIGAQALFDCAVSAGSLPLDLISHMINARPRKEKIGFGKRMALLMPNIGHVELVFRKDGTVLARAGGKQEILTPEEHEMPREADANAESWMILAHVAGQPFEAQSPDGTVKGRVDPALLMEIGTCPIVLRRPVLDEHMNMLLTHEIDGHGSIVCHEAGIVEPITLSILKFLSREGERAAGWISEALERQSLPLLSRIDIAIRRIAGGADTPKAKWANDTLEQIIRPAFKEFPALH